MTIPTVSNDPLASGAAMSSGGNSAQPAISGRRRVFQFPEQCFFPGARHNQVNFRVASLPQLFEQPKRVN